PLRGREVAVRDVDGDALLAFGAEAIGEEGEVHFSQALRRARALDADQRVFEHLLGVVQEPPDERALAVVHGAGGRDAEEVHQKYPSRLRSSIAASLTWSSGRLWPRSVMRVVAISATTSWIVFAQERTAAVQVMSPTVR